MFVACDTEREFYRQECTVNGLWCTVYNIHCKLHTVHRSMSLNSVQCTCTLVSTLHSAQCQGKRLECIVFTVLCSVMEGVYVNSVELMGGFVVCTLQCVVCSVYCLVFMLTL